MTDLFSSLTPDLALLAVATLWGLVQLIVFAVATDLSRSIRINFGNRDPETTPPLTGAAGRMDRACRNFMETFPLFAAAVLIVHVTGEGGALSLVGAHLYVWGRMAYFVAYALGVPVLRSLVWLAATVGIVLVLAALV